jgi:hypothetical protein
MKPQILIEEYDRCLNKIIASSDYITKMALNGDVEGVDLYRAYLHTMVDKAVRLKKLLNDYDYNPNRRDDRLDF